MKKSAENEGKHCATPGMFPKCPGERNACLKDASMEVEQLKLFISCHDFLQWTMPEKFGDAGHLRVRHSV